MHAGTMITDDVRLTKPLPGTTGGALWLADQLDWKKKVVVKLLTNIRGKDDDALAAFLESAAMAQELDSSHVARLYDFGVADDFTPYVVTEWLKGRTLSAELRKHDRLPPARVGEVVAQVTDAVAAGHRIELPHLGLSPDNVYLCDAKGGIDVKVLNFGIANHAPVHRSSEYVAPEQYLGRAVDYRADLWALGALAYLMLTGQHAVDGQKRRLMQWDYEPPSEMWLTDVPPEVDAWFARALHRDPNRRFETCEQMTAEFAELIPGLEHLLVAGEQATAAVTRYEVLEVGAPPPSAPRTGDVLLQEASDDAPGIVIDMEDDA